jgi:MFS family permease
VNFVLVQPPIGVGAMTLGFVYFVCPPSIATTPVAGRAVKRFGTRPTFWASLLVAGIGLPLLVMPNLGAVLISMVLVGIGTFFAQACATGFVGRAATSDRGSASGLYLAGYFFGGLIGSAVLGVIFDMCGWAACVAGIGISLIVAALSPSRSRRPSLRKSDLPQSIPRRRKRVLDLPQSPQRWSGLSLQSGLRGRLLRLHHPPLPRESDPIGRTHDRGPPRVPSRLPFSQVGSLSREKPGLRRASSLRPRATAKPS